MKRLIYILFISIPILVNAQQSWYKSSPRNYMWMNVGTSDYLTESDYWTCLAFNPINGQPYVAFYDPNGLSVLKYDGTNWQFVGNPDFSAAGAGPFGGGLAFNPAGQPYVAFNDGQFYPGGRLTVMKFNGSFWDTVGHAGFSSGFVWDLSLALSTSGEPYVAYSDKGSSWKTTVMKFDGTSWVTVGSPGFSAGMTAYISIAFNPSSGEPFVGCGDGGFSYRATVMKFDGTNWVNVGNPGFSSSFAYFNSLSFSPEAEPFLAYSDSGYSWKTTVMKFDGTNWINVGNSGFSNGQAKYQSLAFAPSGEPFVAFSDYYDSQKATVMKFAGTDWVNVGNPGFSTNSASYTSLAFSPTGVPYVAYIENFGSGGVNVMKYDSVYVGINELNNSQLSVYPNPTSKSITINFKSQQGSLNYIEIEDLKGIRMLETHTKQRTKVLDVENYPAGIYIVKVKTGGSIWIGKFCKE
jgi:hypothetical protein